MYRLLAHNESISDLTVYLLAEELKVAYTMENTLSFAYFWNSYIHFQPEGLQIFSAYFMLHFFSFTKTSEICKIETVAVGIVWSN